MSRPARIIFPVVVLCCGVINAQRRDVQNIFVFLPFQNETDFEGSWNIGTDVPRFLAAYVGERYSVLCISPILVNDVIQSEQRPPGTLADVKFWMELRDRFHAKYLMTGVVTTFTISRFTTGEPTIGGFESFKGEAAVRYVLYDLERTAGSAVPIELFREESAGEYSDRSLALTLFGKPTKRTLEFRDLDRIRFGSEEFNATVIGQACFQLAGRMAGQLEQHLHQLRGNLTVSPDTLILSNPPADSFSIHFKRRVIPGYVVFVEGKDVFINLGSEDGIRIGQTVIVYEEGEELRDPVTSAVLGRSDRKLGDVEVVEVRGPHLALGRVLSKEGTIKVKAMVRVILIE